MLPGAKLGGKRTLAVESDSFFLIEDKGVYAATRGPLRVDQAPTTSFIEEHAMAINVSQPGQFSPNFQEQVSLEAQRLKPGYVRRGKYHLRAAAAQPACEALLMLEHVYLREEFKSALRVIHYVSIAVALIALGLLMVLVGLALIIAAAVNGKKGVKGGAVIIIGPLPIVVGSDTESAQWLIVLATVLTALALIFFAFTAGWLR